MERNPSPKGTFAIDINMHSQTISTMSLCAPRVDKQRHDRIRYSIAI